MPALWTTTSTPPWRSRRCSASAAGACSAVMSSCSAVPRTRVGGRRRGRRPSRARRGRSPCAPSRASTSAIAAPMPRAAPVTSATLPASGRSQSSGAAATPAPDRDHLAVDVRGAAGEQEPQRRLDAVLGAGRDADELRRGAARAAPSPRSARSPRARAGRRRRARRRPPPAACRARAAGRSAPSWRMCGCKKLVGRAQVLAARDARRVEQERPERVVLVGAVARTPARRPSRRRGRGGRRPTPRRRSRPAPARPARRAVRRARRRAARARPVRARRARGGAAGRGRAGRAGARRGGPACESANCW